MALVVVGGHARGVGKTAVIVGLIRALPEYKWTAMKVTGHEHGLGLIENGGQDSAAEDHAVSVWEERPGAHPGKDSTRFLEAGAERSLWVRTRSGMAGALPRILRELAVSQNVICESNTLMGFLEPDLYLSVLDAETLDFKASARLFVNRADALVVIERETYPRWRGVSERELEGKPRFSVRAPGYVSPELGEFVQRRLK